MKRLLSVSFALLLALTPVVALSDSWSTFLSSLSDNEIVQLQKELEAELVARGLALPTVNTKASPSTEQLVWVPRSGKKYHKKKTCSNMKNPRQVTISEAKKFGFTPCSKCKP